MEIVNLQVLDQIQPSGWTRCARFNVSVPGLQLRHWMLTNRGDTFSVHPPRTMLDQEILRTVEFETDAAKAAFLVAALKAYIAAGGQRHAEARVCWHQLLDRHQIGIADKAAGISDAARDTLRLIDRGELPMPPRRLARPVAPPVAAEDRREARAIPDDAGLNKFLGNR